MTVRAIKYSQQLHWAANKAHPSPVAKTPHWCQKWDGEDELEQLKEHLREIQSGCWEAVQLLKKKEHMHDGTSTSKADGTSTSTSTARRSSVMDVPVLNLEGELSREPSSPPRPENEQPALCSSWRGELRLPAYNGVNT